MKPFPTSSIFVLAALLAAAPYAIAQEEAGGLFGLLLGSEPSEPSAAAESDALPAPEEVAPDMRVEPAPPIAPETGTVVEAPAALPEEPPPFASEPPRAEEPPAVAEEASPADDEASRAKEGLVEPLIEEDATAGGEAAEPAPSAVDEIAEPEVDEDAPAAAAAEPLEEAVSPEAEPLPGIERAEEDHAATAPPAVDEPFASPPAEQAAARPAPLPSLDEPAPPGDAVASRTEPRPAAPGNVALPETEIQGEIEKPDIFFLLPKARDQSDDQVIRARIRREITRPLVKEWLEEMMLLK